MYQFSRSIYRELAPKIAATKNTGQAAKQHVLGSCEMTMQRLVEDRRYFARPTKALFGELRGHFQVSDQLYVYEVVDRNIKMALRYLDSVSLEELAKIGRRDCRAHTRKGTPCQREPLPGRDYCPSHKHLEETESIAVAQEKEREMEEEREFSLAA